MSKTEKPRNTGMSLFVKVFKILAAVFITYVVIVSMVILFGVLAEDGTLLKCWYSLADYLPFGRQLAMSCVSYFQKRAEAGADMSRYLNELNNSDTVAVSRDICVLVFTAILLELTNVLVQLLADRTKKHGIRGWVIRMVLGMGSALLCTLLATYLLGFTHNAFENIPGLLKSVMALFAAAGALAGSVGVAHVFLGLGMLFATIFVLFKVIIVNALKVLFTYVSILMAVLFLNEQSFARVFSLFAGWSLVLVGLIFLDVLISSALRKK